MARYKNYLTKLPQVTAAMLLVLCCLFSSHASAAPARGGGVTVSPVIEQLTINRHQQDNSFLVTITNHSTEVVSITVKARNFSSLNLTGALNFDTTQSGSATGHQLAGALHPALPQLVIGPGQTTTDQIEVTNANTLSAGGHYAALIYEIDAQSSGKNNAVQIQEAVSTLVFVSTAGVGTQSLRVVPPIVQPLYTSFPRSINAVFANDGNTQSTLRGTVRIYNAASLLVGQGQMNVNSNIILPGSERLFTIPLESFSKPKSWFGTYTLAVTYAHDGQAGSTTYRTTFRYVNAAIVGVAATTAAVTIALLLILWHVLRKRRLLREIQNRRRRETTRSSHKKHKDNIIRDFSPSSQSDAAPKSEAARSAHD